MVKQILGLTWTTILLATIAVFCYNVWSPIITNLFHSDEMGYGDTSAFPNHKENICVATGNTFDFEVKIIYDPIDKDTIGSWNPSNYVITLDPVGGLNMDTIAHEVYHMVETVMAAYQVKDSHYGAYLQGNWTRCVQAIVAKDHTIVYSDSAGIHFQFDEDWDKPLSPFRFYND